MSSTSIAIGRLNFRCPVCGRIEPRYKSIVICTLGRDRTICVECAETIEQAMAQLRRDEHEH